MLFDHVYFTKVELHKNLKGSHVWGTGTCNIRKYMYYLAVLWCTCDIYRQFDNFDNWHLIIFIFSDLLKLIFVFLVKFYFAFRPMSQKVANSHFLNVGKRKVHLNIVCYRPTQALFSSSTNTASRCDGAGTVLTTDFIILFRILILVCATTNRLSP